jgi:pyruvate dehydrogenase E1 component beta subunit
MKTTRKLTMAQAISEAIAQEMTRDDSVFVMGEDIGAYGGIFGATGGLLEQFGKDRIMDTPISETAFIGTATGAAAAGLRPIVELMFVDFFGVCMDQIYNHLAKNTYMSGGHVKLPVVLTTLSVRRAVRQLLAERHPQLAVLCYQELTPELNIQLIARIDWT